MNKTEENDTNMLTESIISCGYTVSNGLGAGFLEKVYENAMVLELSKRGFSVESQKAISVYYGDKMVGEYYADIFVERAVIIELKVVKCIDSTHIAQTLNYLKACNLHCGIILNFKNQKLEIKRVVL